MFLPQPSTSHHSVGVPKGSRRYSKIFPYLSTTVVTAERARSCITMLTKSVPILSGGSRRNESQCVFDFSFALDPDTSTITSVHPPAIHVIFEINPFAAQRWADGYYSLVDCTSPEVAPFLTNTTVKKLSNKRVANQLHENLTTAL